MGGQGDTTGAPGAARPPVHTVTDRFDGDHADLDVVLDFVGRLGYDPRTVCRVSVNATAAGAPTAFEVEHIAGRPRLRDSRA